MGRGGNELLVTGSTMAKSQSLPSLNKAMSTKKKSKTQRKSTLAKITTTSRKKISSSAAPLPLPLPLPLPSVRAKKPPTPVGFLRALTKEEKAAGNKKRNPQKGKVNMQDARERCNFAWDEDNRMEVLRSQITIKYSHYNSTFEARNGICRWADIDEKYAISFVFQGNFLRHVINERAVGGWRAMEVCEDESAAPVKNVRDPSSKILRADYFMGLSSANNNEYLLVLDEDEKEGRGNSAKKVIYIANANANANATNTKTKASELLTNELKKFCSSELKAKGEEMKEMLEARDVEEILYGN